MVDASSATVDVLTAMAGGKREGGVLTVTVAARKEEAVLTPAVGATTRTVATTLWVVAVEARTCPWTRASWWPSRRASAS